MKVREQLNKRIIPMFGLMLLCFVLVAVALMVAPTQLLLLLPVAGFVVCVFFLQYGIRCPKCNNPVAQLIYLHGGGYFRLSKKIRFCRFCGLDFDTDIESAGKRQRESII